MDVLRAGEAWLASKKRECASSPVRYVRASDGLVLDILAEIGRTLRQQSDEDGWLREVSTRDYLIAAADLTVNGETFEPLRGDRIVETVGDREYVYEVLPLPGEPAAVASGLHHLRWRLHTKLIEK